MPANEQGIPGEVIAAETLKEKVSGYTELFIETNATVDFYVEDERGKTRFLTEQLAELTRKAQGKEDTNSDSLAQHTKHIMMLETDLVRLRMATDQAHECQLRRGNSFVRELGEYAITSPNGREDAAQLLGTRLQQLLTEQGPNIHSIATYDSYVRQTLKNWLQEISEELRGTNYSVWEEDVGNLLIAWVTNPSFDAIKKMDPHDPDIQGASAGEYVNRVLANAFDKSADLANK